MLGSDNCRSLALFICRVSRASPENAEAYNGQQGDGFDAQKDMLMATFGAILGLVAMHRRAK